MLDIKRIREDYEGVKAGVERRTKGSFGIEKIPALDEKRRAVLAEVEAMKNKQNTVSKEIPKLKKAGEDTTAIMAEMRELSDEIKVLDAQVSQLDAEIKDTLLNIPNVPADFVQVGEDDSANVEIRKFKEPTKFDFEPKAEGTGNYGNGKLPQQRAAYLFVFQQPHHASTLYPIPRTV